MDGMRDIPEAVHGLERELRGIFGSRLQSLVVYGLAAQNSPGRADEATHHVRHNPQTHTLAVVEALSADDLRACAGRVTGWHDAALATPLLLAAHEFDRLLDAFPYEFGGILSDHIVVSGNSPFDGLKVEADDLRRACEIQARGHLLHLREGYVETRGRSDAVAVLIVRSAAAFAALVTAVARLEGQAPPDASAAARHIERALGLAGPTAGEIVALVDVHEISGAEAERLFPAYLDAAERLAKYVDRWTRA
jgi:hypothetical protein